MFPCFGSCASQFTGAYFYEGLKKGRDGEKTEALDCFVKALETDNPYISSAAAAELLELHFSGTELSAEILKKIRQKTNAAAGNSDDFWAAVLDIIDNTIDAREKALGAILNNRDRPVDSAVLHLLQELRSLSVLSQAENAAINGRIAVSRFSYNEAVSFFRITLESSPWLFFRYPDLIIDLGRSFQYATATKDEGIQLFLEWEKKLGFSAAMEDMSPLRKVIPLGSENLVRYRLLFYAARIARQRGDPHIELFEQALLWALSLPADIQNEQIDACIWYILNDSMNNGADQALQYIQKYISQWRDDLYFFDIMDKLTRNLIINNRWGNILDLFTLAQNYSNALTAKYAWIIARAIEEEYLSPEEIIYAAEMIPFSKFAEQVKIPAADAEAEGSFKKILANVYKQIAYDKGIQGTNAQYYRAFASNSLEKPFLQFEKQSSADNANTDKLQFLKGFFEFGAGQFAFKYLKMMEKDMTEDELRDIAAILNEAGQYQQSIRLVSLYADKKTFQAKRQDLELLYPRPYKNLVEQYAKETGIETAVLFGLIHTESAFETNAVSRAGAVGLTQLIPSTAQETASRLLRAGGPDYFTDEKIDLHDPEKNIHIGAFYLAYLNELTGDPLLALLSYNGGINRIRRWYAESARPSSTVNGSSSQKNMPVDLFLETVEFPETKNYGRKVLAAAAMYRELYYSP